MCKASCSIPWRQTVRFLRLFLFFVMNIRYDFFFFLLLLNVVCFEIEKVEVAFAGDRSRKTLMVSGRHDRTRACAINRGGVSSRS